MEEQEILTNFNRYKLYYLAYNNLMVSVTIFGVPAGGEFKTPHEFMVDYVHKAQPNLSIEFIDKIDDLLYKIASYRLSNNIKFETEEEYQKDDFKYIQEHFND